MEPTEQEKEEAPFSNRDLPERATSERKDVDRGKDISQEGEGGDV